MAEQLAREQLARHGGAVDGSERLALAAAVAGVVDGVGEALLAGAGLAEDEDRHVAKGGPLGAADGQSDGRAVATDSLEAGDLLRGAGGDTLVVWIKASCPTCQLAMPFVERIHQAVATAGRHRVIVVCQDPPAEIAAFRVAFACPTVPVLSESEPYAAADQYGITNVPTMFLVGDDGRIKCSDVGFAKAGLEGLLTRLAGSGHSLFTDAEDEALPALRPG